VYAFSGLGLTAEAARKVLGVPPDSLFFSLVHSIFAHDQKVCFEIVDQACSMGIELSVFLDGLSKFLRNLLFARVSGLNAEALEITETFYAQLQSIAPDISNGDILRLAKILSDTQGQIKHANNPRLLVETAFARMAWLDRVADLKKILTGIESQGTTEAVKKKILSDHEPKAASASIAFASVSSPLPPTISAAPSFSTSVEPMAPGHAIDRNGSTAIPVAPKDPATTPFPLSASSLDLPPTDHDDIVISFGDDPAQSKAPTVSKFELVAQWKRVLKDFSQIEPLAGAYLESTTLSRGDFNVTPFTVRIIFRGDSVFNYTQFTGSPAYPNTIQDYLETILQTRVDVLFELTEAAQGDALAQNEARLQTKSSPAAAFERDKEREPILAVLTETFEATWVGTKARQRPKFIPSPDMLLPVEENS
jgi:DNA polymerase-3 subunit gamma/tau